MQADGHGFSEPRRIDAYQTIAQSPARRAIATQFRQGNSASAAVFHPAASVSRLFRAQLANRAEPVFHVKGLADLAVPDGLDIDRHDAKALAGMRHAKQVTRGRAG